MKYVLLLLACFVLFACRTQQFTQIEPSVFIINKPELESLSEVEIGNPIIVRETGHKYKAIKITKKYIIKTGSISKELQEGEIFVNDGYTTTHDLYSNFNGQTFGIAIPQKTGTLKAFIKSGNSVKFNEDDITADYEENVSFKVPQRQNLKQEFIYNGKVGEAIKFTYREFVNDLARPSYTQDLQYDLKESSLIGFKGLRIKIISATNSKINYKVLNHFAN